MKVLQLIDSLHAGGAERVAINIANALSSKIDESYICTTREEGVLKNIINTNVKYLFLNKKKTIDFGAIKRLNKFIKEHKINVIHAHSSSFFTATLVKLLNKKIRIIWHDHFGDRAQQKRLKTKVLKFCSQYFETIITVNKDLKSWATKELKCKNVVFLPNFANLNANELKETKLNGSNGKRIISLANLRHPKNHIMLLNAFKEVYENEPEWSLHLVGDDLNDSYSKELKTFIKSHNLEKAIYFYGKQTDVKHILSQCSMGVISSTSEGLPLALLEYGMAKLAVISTNVGDCCKIVINNKSGFLIENNNQEELQVALIKLIANKELRLEFADELDRTIQTEWSEESVIKKLLKIYN